MLVNPKGNQFLVHFYFMVQTHFFEPHLISSFRKTFFMMAEKIDELFIFLLSQHASKFRFFTEVEKLKKSACTFMLQYLPPPAGSRRAVIL